MSDEILKQTTEELAEEQWMLILWSLLTDIPEKEWNEFSHDLIYKDRFSSSHQVVETIKTYAERCTATIKSGHILYRARVYHQDPFREFIYDVFKDTFVREAPDNLGDISDFYYMQLAALVMAIEKRSSQSNAIIDIYNKWKRKRFKGYNALASGAPPADIGSAGRINPERIRYLYLAEDLETAAYEVRPTIGQYVSVATFKTIDEIKIYDLAREIKSQEGETPEYNHTLFSLIQQRFSEPNNGDAFRYLPTQYLGELIKRMGFDGLRFKSSLKKGGINTVLFDDTKCKAIRSDLIKVGDIKLILEKPEIYQLEELLRPNESRDQ